MTPKVKQPNEIKAVYLHDNEYFLTYLMGSITLAYQPMTVRKGVWPAIAFNNPEQCRRIAKELTDFADQVDKVEAAKKAAKASTKTKGSSDGHN